MALNNVPLTGQSLGVTKVPVNQNFSTIDTTYSVDHVTFNNATNVGFHNKVTLVQQSVAPAISLPNTGFWSQLNSTTNQPETWVAAVVAAGLKSYPLTASILSTVAAPAAFSSGWTYLPSGILLKWGTGNVLAPPGPGTITFPTGANIPAFNTVISVMLSANSAAGDPNSMVYLTSVGATNFTVYATPRISTGPGQCGFQYLAIGY